MHTIKAALALSTWSLIAVAAGSLALFSMQATGSYDTRGCTMLPVGKLMLCYGEKRGPAN